MENKLKLSEIIKTDCYIDCGSSTKLRESIKVLEGKYKFTCRLKKKYIKGDDFISIYADSLSFIPTNSGFTGIPTHHISQIDLNA